MENIESVGLGFAEFVSQLISETFEACLSAQSYQLEKYLEIENLLRLNDADFYSTLFNAEDLKNKEVELFQTELELDTQVTSELKETILQYIDNPNSISLIENSMFTEEGLNYIKDFLKIVLISQKREIYQTLLNKPEFARLVIESGQINAKLDLSSLYQSTDKEKQFLKKTSKKEVSKEILQMYATKVKEIVNPANDQKILIIDREDLIKDKRVNFHLPNNRIIVTPINSKQASTISSSVTINFKL